jgi:hypothetical protein
VIETMTTGVIDTLLYLVQECINQPSSQCFYHWVDTSTGELLVLDCMNQPSSQCCIDPVIETLTTGVIDTLQY